MQAFCNTCSDFHIEKAGVCGVIWELKEDKQFGKRVRKHMGTWNRGCDQKGALIGHMLLVPG